MLVAEAGLWTMSNLCFLEAPLSSDVRTEETNEADVALPGNDPVLFGMRGSSRLIASMQGG
ncbi:MAG: hypothetical protein ACLQB4_07700 [Beijerinckiaceae bacterium]